MKTHFKRALILLLLILLLAGCGKNNVSFEATPSPDIAEVPPSPSPTPTPMPKSPAEDIPLYWKVSDGTTSLENMMPLAEAEENYTSSTIAAEDGCVVKYFLEKDYISGEDIWNSFVETSLAGTPCKTRLVKIILREVDPVTKEPYDEPVEEIYIEDVEFTGDVYVSTYYTDPSGSGNKKIGYQIIRPLKDEELSDKGEPLDPLFTNYGGDAELAQKDGCIVVCYKEGTGVGNTSTECVSGSERFHMFLEKAGSGEHDAVRIALCGKAEDGKLSVDETLDVIYDEGYYYHRYYTQFDGVWCEVFDVYEHLEVFKGELVKDTYALINTTDYFSDITGLPRNKTDQIIMHWRLFAE